MKRNSIVIADDHPIVLTGLRLMLRSKDYHISAQFTNGINCFNYIVKNKPTLAILDIDMPGLSGLEVIRKVRSVGGIKTRFILLTMHREESVYRQAIKLGVQGYLLKLDVEDKLIECISKVFSGRTYFPDGLYRNLMADKKGPSVLNQFSKTQQKVIKLIAKGKKTPEIAEILHVSRRTVDTHRNAINKKLRSTVSAETKLADWVRSHMDELDM